MNKKFFLTQNKFLITFKNFYFKCFFLINILILIYYISLIGGSWLDCIKDLLKNKDQLYVIGKYNKKLFRNQSLLEAEIFKKLPGHTCLFTFKFETGKLYVEVTSFTSIFKFNQIYYNYPYKFYLEPRIAISSEKGGFQGISNVTRKQECHDNDDLNYLCEHLFPYGFEINKTNFHNLNEATISEIDKNLIQKKAIFLYSDILSYCREIEQVYYIDLTNLKSQISYELNFGFWSPSQKQNISFADAQKFLLASNKLLSSHGFFGDVTLKKIYNSQKELIANPHLYIYPNYKKQDTNDYILNSLLDSQRSHIIGLTSNNISNSKAIAYDNDSFISGNDIIKSQIESQIFKDIV